MWFRTLATTAVLLMLAAGTSLAADQPGRYTMTPADSGSFVRLDTQTGAMSVCRPDGGNWSCKPMAGDDASARQEIDRLTAENSALKAEVRRLEELLLPPDGRPAPAPGTKAPGLQLPSEQDIDRAFTYLEGLLKRFQDRMKQFEDKQKGTPL